MSAHDKHLTEAEVATRIRIIEKRHGLLGERVDGVSPWQLVRFETSMALQNLSPRRRPASQSTIAKRSAKGLAQVLLGGASVSYVCKTFDSAMRVLSDGKYRDIYFDEVLSARPDGVKLSSCDAAGYEQNIRDAAIPPTFDDTAIIALSAVLGRLFPRRRRHEAFDRIAAAVSSETPMKEFSARRVAQVYNVFRWRVDLYKIILRRLRPKVVYCADSGQFALMKAAEQLSIPFVEVQHGVCTNIHPNILPEDVTEDERVGLLVPMKFAVYGPHSKAALASTLLSKEARVTSVGAAYVEAARAIRQSEWSADGPVVLTVTAQGVAMEALATFISAFLRASDDNLTLHLKLHPAYNGDESYYREKLGSDRRVKIWSGQSDVSTHRLIALSHLHLSISSTCHYDALGIGTPTGILELETYESVLDIQGNQGVTLIQTPEQLAQMVSQRDFPDVPETTAKHFFERDFVGNMLAFLA